MAHKRLVISLEEDDDEREVVLDSELDLVEEAMLAEQAQYFQTKQQPSASHKRKERPQRTRKDSNPPSNDERGPGIGIGIPSSISPLAFTGMIKEKFEPLAEPSKSFQPPRLTTTAFPYVPHRSEQLNVKSFGRLKEKTKDTVASTPVSMTVEQPKDAKESILLEDNQFSYILPETELEKLAWMKEDKSQEIEQAKSHETERYDFDGHIIDKSTAANIPTHLGLHHHGLNPESPGYTIAEILRLARSKVASQRVMALQMLSNIISRAKELLRAGEKSSIFDYLFNQKIVTVLRSAIDDANLNALTRGISALHTFLISSNDEEWMTEHGFFFQGNMLISLSPGHKGRKNAAFDVHADQSELEQRTINVEEDATIAKQDVIYGLVFRMGLLQRINFLLNGKIRKGLGDVEDKLLDILIRCARHSKQVASEIVECPGLLELISKDFIQSQVQKEYTNCEVAKSIFGSNIHLKAIKLIKCLVQTGGKDVCTKVVGTGIINNLFRFISTPVFSAPDCYYFIESLRTIEICVSYEIYLPTMTSFFVEFIPRISNLQACFNKKERNHVDFLICTAIFHFLECYVHFAVATTVDDAPSSTWGRRGSIFQPAISVLALLNLENSFDETLLNLAGSIFHMLASYLECAKEREQVVSISADQAKRIYPTYIGSFLSNSVLLKSCLEQLRIEALAPVSSLSSLPELSLLSNQILISDIAANCLNGFIRSNLALFSICASLSEEVLTDGFSLPEFVLHLILLLGEDMKTLQAVQSRPTTLFQLRPRVLLALNAVKLIKLHLSTSFNAQTYLITFSLMAWFLPGDECHITYLLRSILFDNQVLLSLSKEIDAGQIATFDFCVCLPNVIRLSELFITNFSTNEAIIESIALQKYQVMKITSMLLPFEISTLPLPADWFLLPIAMYSDDQQHNAKVEEILRNFLGYFCTLIKQANAKCNEVSSSAVCCALMRIFLMNDIFLEPGIAEILKNILHKGIAELAPSFLSPNGTKKWVLDTSYSNDFSINSLEKAAKNRLNSLFQSFVQQFESSSFGQETFAETLLIFFSMGVPSTFRKTILEDVLGLHLLNVDPIFNVSQFLFPLEVNEEIIDSYVSSLIAGKLSKERAYFLFWMAIHHVSHYVFLPAFSDEKEINNTKWKRKVALKSVLTGFPNELLLTLVGYFVNWRSAKPTEFPPLISALESPILADNLKTLREYLNSLLKQLNINDKSVISFISDELSLDNVCQRLISQMVIK